MNTVLNESAAPAVKTYVDIITTEPRKNTKKAPTTKAEPERELDWRPIGIVKEHRTAKQRAARKIERLHLRYMAFALNAFIMGASVGIMIFNWLH